MKTTSAAEADPRRWLALAVVATAQFLVTLDSSIVNVALPSMRADLGLSESGLAWVVNAYVLAFGGFLLLFGRIADIVGRREVFIAGAVLFTGASLLAGISSSAEALLAARALQGLGAAALSPAALAIVINTFPVAERARALGIWGAVAAGGGSAGVLFGGLITDGLGWEWVFFVTVPVSTAAALVAPAVLRRVPGTGLGAGFDVWGAVTVTGGVAAAVYAVLQGSELGWAHTSSWGALVAAAALIAAFVAIERRVASPLVPLRVFASRNFSGGSAVTLLAGAALMALWFLMTLYMQLVLGYDPRQTGFAYLPMTATIFVVSVFVVARLVGRFGPRTVVAAGLGTLAVSLTWLALLPADAGYAPQVLPALLLGAVGLGLTYMPATMATVSGVRPSEAGLASGVASMAFQVGGALGVAVLASVSAATASSARAAGAAGHEAVADGISAALLVGALVAAAALALAVAVLRRQPAQPAAPAESADRLPVRSR